MGRLVATVVHRHGRYDAAVERTRPEWPPAPDRLYQALIAAAGSERTAAEHDALARLERLPAPVIHAPVAALTAGVTRWGPAFDRPAASLGFPAVRDPKKPVDVGRALLEPDPQAFPYGPVTVFEWDDPDGLISSADVDVLAGLAAQVSYLGRATSTVTVTVTYTDTVPVVPEETVRWTTTAGLRSARAVLIAVPVPGRLARLDAHWEACNTSDERLVPPGPARVRYAPDTTAPPAPEIRDRVPLPPLVLLRPDTLIPATKAVLATSAVAARCPARARVVPQVRVGDGWADGTVLGFSVSGTPTDLEAARRAFTGGAPVPGVGTVRVVEPGDAPAGMTPARWQGPSRTWVTVLPFTVPVGIAANDHAARLAARAVGAPGRVVRTGRQPILTGAPHAAAVRVPDGLRAWHAEIVFDEPVTGPFSLGEHGAGLLFPLDPDGGDL